MNYYADETARAAIAAAAYGDCTSLAAIAAEVAASPRDAIAEVIRQLATVAAMGVRSAATAHDRPLDEHLGTCYVTAAAVFL